MKRRYTILVDNIGYHNRGDQMMVMSVLEELWRHVPSCQIVVRKSYFMKDTSFCMAHDIYPMQEVGKIRSHSLYRFAINFLLRKKCFIVPSDIDLVLNCRGFYLSDFWSYVNQTSDETKYYSRFRPKTKFVFLPQAFGPFLYEHSRTIMKYVYSKADIIYTRDNTSYQYLMEMFPLSAKIKLSPDFTCLFHPTDGGRIRISQNKLVLIIPNVRMTDKVEGSLAENYFAFLKTVCEYLLERKEHVVFLNHEGVEDDLLIRKVNNTLSVKIPVFTNLTGGDVKQLIAKAKLVVSSRYHGVINALSQGVPVLCTSWSHKYIELLKEYHMENSMLDVNDIESSVKKINEAIENPDFFVPRPEIELGIEEKVHAMWTEIWECAGVV